VKKCSIALSVQKIEIELSSIVLGGFMEIAQVRSIIRKVLMEEWDPINVKDCPQAADEYDGYIWEIYGLLKREPSDEKLVQYFVAVEYERMGLTGINGASVGPSESHYKVVQSLRRELGLEIDPQDGAPKA